MPPRARFPRTRRAVSGAAGTGRLPGKRQARRRAGVASRRSDILKAAAAVLLERGYAGGAMSDVARRLGGSKGTLYRYFESKHALFAAVAGERAARYHRIFDGFSASSNLAFDLRRLARAHLAFVSSEAHLALHRALIAEVGKSDVGKAFFEEERKIASAPLAARIGAAMDQGRLRRFDSRMAATHFRALCQSDVYEQRLRGVIDKLAPEEISRAADDAVDMFLRAYGVEEREPRG
jgi:AcrR family transcriptional regulator